MRARALTLLTGLLLLSVPVAGQTIERSFSVSEGGSLDLDLKVGGSLTIIGSQSNRVEAVIEVDGEDAEQLEMDFAEANGRVTVRSKADGRRADINVSYTFRVPSLYDLKIQLTGGSVEIDGVSGKLEGQTMGGALSLTDVGGTIDLQTMGGAIHLSNSQVDGRLHTMGGRIDVEDVTGDVDATTMGGNIRFHDVRPRGARPLKAETMGGDVHVTDAPAGANVSTMGGDIRTGDIGEYLKANTMGGDIETGAVAGWIEATTMGGDITAAVVGTGDDRHVELSSMGGDIDLTVPAGLSMDIEIELNLRGDRVDENTYRIDSDFPLESEATGWTDSRNSDRQMTISAMGSSSGGRNAIRITTTNGNVTLRRGS